MARFDLNLGRVLKGALDGDENIRLNGQEATQSALGDPDQEGQGSQHRLQGQEVSVLIVQGVESTVDLFPGVNNSEGSRAEGTTGSRWDDWETVGFWQGRTLDSGTTGSDGGR